MNSILENKNELNLSLLGPRMLGENDKSFTAVRYLEAAMEKEEVRNVAVSGPYGSGKSSVLRTYVERNQSGEYGRVRKILSISLATLGCQKQILEQNQGDPGSADDTFLKSVEYSILQQLLYKEKNEVLPASDFHRIPFRSISKNLIYCLMAMTFILSVVYLCLKYKTGFGVITAVSCIVLIGIHVLYMIVERSSFPHVESIGVSKVQMKLHGFSPDSVFNRYMDEIVYFFKKTAYQLVIFEDIDRFGKPELFNKLRELNFLLNGNDDIKANGGVTFIYALKDDILGKCEERTKFFDVIIPVIPIINFENSEVLLESELAMRGFGEWCDRLALRQIAMYLKDMRLLKNVTNEFAQYAAGLGIRTSDDERKRLRLLAMILFKNTSPEEFAKLHMNEGAVANLFKGIPEYRKSLSLALDEKIKTAESVVEESRKQVLADSAVIRKEYLDAIKVSGGVIKQINVGGRSLPLNEIAASSDLFEKLTKMRKITVIYNNSSGIRSYMMELDFDFSKVETLVDKSRTYNERINSLTFSLAADEFRLEEKEDEKVALSGLDAAGLFSKYGFGDKLSKYVPDGSVLGPMVKAGLIAEDHMSYLSYFFEGGMSASDWGVLQEMKMGRCVDFLQHIDCIEPFALNVPDYVCGTDGVLICELVDFIFRHSTEYSDMWKKIKTRICRKESLPFLSAYFAHYDDNKDIFTAVNAAIPLLWQEIVKLDEELQRPLLRAFFLYSEVWAIGAPVISWLNENCDFVDEMTERFGLEAVKEKIDRCRFISLSCRNEALRGYVVKKSLYELNRGNVAFLCNSLLGRVVDENELSLALVIETGDTDMFEYVCGNLEYCMANVFAEAGKSIETQESALAILLDSDVQDDTVLRYLDGLAVIENLGDVPDERRAEAFRRGMAVASWRNVLEYFNCVGKIIDEDLQKFLDVHYKKLSLSEFPSNQRVFQRCFASCAGLSFIAYRNLAPVVCKGYKHIGETLSALGEDKLHTLIRIGCLPYNDENVALFEGRSTRLRCYYFKKYPAKFAAGVASASLTVDDGVMIFKDPAVGFKVKNAVAKAFSASQYTSSRELCTLVCRYTVGRGLSLPRSVWREIVSGSTDCEAALNVALSLVKKTDNNDFARSMIEALPYGFAQILNSSVIVRNDSDDAKALLSEARRRGFINNFFPVQGGFRVSHKRK